MSLSASLYDSYALLYDRFSTAIFSFDDVLATLRLSQQGGLKRASLLRGRGYMVLFGRLGRSRQYRLLSPEQAMFAHLHMKNLDALGQGRYLHLLIDVCSQLHRAKPIGLQGLWLFGSVARGDARDNSDLDLMVVAKKMAGNQAEMTDRIYAAIDISRERQFLYENGISTDVSIYALKQEEVGRFYPMILDVLEDGIVIYEKDRILSHAAESMRARATQLGLKRMNLKKGWMWTLPPGLEVGESFEVREAV